MKSQDMHAEPKSSFTPGPWTWGEKYKGLFGPGEENAVLDYIPYEGMHLAPLWNGPQQDANARLIAAAWTMLAILQTVDQLLRDKAPAAMILDENSPTLDAIRDVLAKVRGVAP